MTSPPLRWLRQTERSTTTAPELYVGTIVARARCLYWNEQRGSHSHCTGGMVSTPTMCGV
jgi:hypothetical protein